MIPRSTTLTPQGRRLRRALLWIVVTLILGNVAVGLIGALIGGERVAGPPGSSYVTTAFGAAALAELVEAEGMAVERLRAPIIPGRLDPSQALVMIEVGLSTLAPPELAALTEYIEGGGRLVLAGPDPSGLISTLRGVDTGPAWEPGGPELGSSQLPGVDAVPLSGEGRIEGWDEPEVFLEGGDGEVVGVEWDSGSGSVAWLADARPLLNVGLAKGDSAGLAVSLLQGRDVVFDEYRHGFGGDSFLELLPDGWSTTLTLLGVAALAWLLAYGRRLGPPEDTERRLQPERAAYVESVAAILGRTGRTDDATTPVRDRARRLLARRAGISPDSPDYELHRAGADAGLTESEIAAVLGQSQDAAEAGRALARLSARR